MKAAKDLCTATVETQSTEFDFSQGYGETWEVVMSEKIHKACDSGDDEYDYYMPMMNYYYPLPDTFARHIRPETAADILAKSSCNLTLIEFLKDYGSRYALALTGGGMDLSWEICEAYTLLGYLPPLAFCRVPRLAGMKLNARTKRILAACNRTVSVSIFRAECIRRDIRLARASLREKEEGR